MVKTMGKHNKRTVRRIELVLVVFVSLLFRGRANAQATGPISQEPRANSSALEEYKIGPDDVLQISVADAPEFGGKFRVSDAGLIEIAGISTPIHAEGQSALELAHTIQAA